MSEQGSTTPPSKWYSFSNNTGLKRMGIEAYFFVYSSAFSDYPDLLEVYRYFRTSFYDEMDKFYDDFFAYIKKRDEKALGELFCFFILETILLGKCLFFPKKPAIPHIIIF